MSLKADLQEVYETWGGDSEPDEALYFVIAYVRMDVIDWQPDSYIDRQLYYAEQEASARNYDDALEYIENALDSARGQDARAIDELLNFVYIVT